MVHTKLMVWMLALSHSYSIAAMYAVPNMVEQKAKGPVFGEVHAQAKQLPTIPVDLGSVGKLSISDSNAAYNLQNEHLIFNLNTGLQNSGRSRGSAGADIAVMASENSALGLKLLFSPDKSEVVLGGVSHLNALGLRVRGALSYMHGSQEFNFYRSTEQTNLSQLGYYGSVDWLNQAESDVGLHSLGVALWGAKAKNRSSFDTQTYADETADYWIITSDQRLISSGTLTGVAVNFQYAPNIDLIIKSAIGAEQLRFPFSDGSAEENTTPFFDAQISYRVTDNSILSLGYKYGASEKGVFADWKCSAYTLAVYKTYGQAGLQGGYNVNLSVEVMELLATRKRKPSDLTLAANLRQKMHDNSKQLMQEAITRPMQLPSNFLAKVDETGVSQRNSTNGILREAQDNALIAIAGTGNITINAVEHNGVNVPNMAHMAVRGKHVLVGQQLPGGNYIAHVTDTTGKHSTVTFSVEESET